MGWGEGRGGEWGVECEGMRVGWGVRGGEWDGV